MGATVSLLVAGARNDLVSGLALIEPVILPASAYAFAQLPLGPALMRAQPLARGARARRNAFTDRESAAAAFRGRGVFKTFPPEMISDYVTDALVESGKGGFKLACRPGYEAATYCAQRHDPWAALRKVTDPLVLLRAERGSTISEAAMHRVAAIKADARVATVEGAGHMLPMERPDRVRSAIESAALMAQAGRKYHSGLE
jgi:pimeloyl-ACP methyl ester carboxylesterase